MIRKNLLLLLFMSFSIGLLAQTSQLTVEKIMRDPKWMGTSPENIFWDHTSENIYFNWNPKSEDLPSLFKITPKSHDPQKVEFQNSQSIIRQVSYDQLRKRYVYVQNGDIFLTDVKSGQTQQLTRTSAIENSPRFGPADKSVVFLSGDNIFELSLDKNELRQLVNFSKSGMGGSLTGRQPTTSNQANSKESIQNQWLKTDQLSLFDILKEEKKMDSLRRKARANSDVENKTNEIKNISIHEGTLGMVNVSPDLRFVSYRVTKMASGNKSTFVPNYVTESGYTEEIPTRTKVGNELSVSKTFIYDRQTDQTYQIKTSSIPGIRELPDFWNDYPKEKAALVAKNEDRQVSVTGPYWNPSGHQAFVVVTSADNKDRWIMRLDPETGDLTLIDRQRDEAWIGGPGISGFGGGNIGWINDETLYFQSEATGYSHLYIANINSGNKQQLTSGNWEVQGLQLSNDKKFFYLTGNKEHPGIKHFYRIPTQGGELVQITQMKGGNEVSLSPDEKWLAIRYSYANKPWELFIQENKPGAKAIQVTESTSEEFKAYPWRDPKMIVYKNRHGDDVHARLYQPQKQKNNKPAVIFVHGAGYLQNVHYWWSQYFREYMFHNLLTDLGYTVLDIDYTASSGYGRNHRTGIYRHMGGKDLSDQVDGAKLLVEQYGVNAKNIGIYGGSYGGFITLMALFNEPDVFAAGGALRSVTDWAHYNHGYTANILNEPFNDPIAYKRSSPIYFADGLKGHLLMCHGMLDVNVHFQDIVRLSQRLIELGKDNWELAVYPIEDHGFVTPSGWTDEYKRILKLFEERLTHP